METRLADAGLMAAGSVAGWSWLTNLTTVAEAAVVVVTAVGGCFAAWYYYERARAMRKERMNDSSTKGKGRKSNKGRNRRDVGDID